MPAVDLLDSIHPTSCEDPKTSGSLWWSWATMSHQHFTFEMWIMWMWKRMEWKDKKHSEFSWDLLWDLLDLLWKAHIVKSTYCGIYWICSGFDMSHLHWKFWIPCRPAWGWLSSEHLQNLQETMVQNEGNKAKYHLVNVYITMENPAFLMVKLTISMAIFNSYKSEVPAKLNDPTKSNCPIPRNDPFRELGAGMAAAPGWPWDQMPFGAQVTFFWFMLYIVSLVHLSFCIWQFR